MGSTEKTLDEALQRFDQWLGTQPREVQNRLARGAAAAQIDKTKTALALDVFPEPLRALYAWHDGEGSGDSLFDPLCNDRYRDTWTGHNEQDPLEVRFMNLSEVRHAGAFPVHVDDEQSRRTCMHATKAHKANARLIPFLWLRPQVARLIREDGSETREPEDDDWIVAIDTKLEAVWLFEVGGDSLETIEEEAPSLSTYLEALLDKAIQENLVLGEPLAAGAPPKVEPPASLLLRLLAEKEMIELAPDTTVADLADRLGPLLLLAPRKRAVKAAAAFFVDDDGIAEVYVDDDVLKALVAEYLG